MIGTSTQLSEWIQKPDDKHLVGYYASSDDLVENLNNYILIGLQDGCKNIVIARSIHIKMLHRRLLKNWQDFSLNLEDDTCVFISAESLLDDIVTGQKANLKKLERGATQLLDRYVEGGQPLRIYADLVSMLWENNKKEAAVEIEKLWNDLSKKYNFSLWCGYTDDLFENKGFDPDVVSSIHDISYRQIIPA